MSNTRINGSLALGVALLIFVAGCQTMKTASVPVPAADVSGDDKIIVFEGIIEKISPNPGVASGGFAVYQLAKYRVEKVCKGKFAQKEMVVDHIVLDLKEFEGFKVGDRICLTVKASSEVFTRYNAEGIREPSETIDTFYVAMDRLKRVELSANCCAP